MGPKPFKPQSSKMLNTSQELKGMKTYQNYLAEQREKTWRRDREKAEKRNPLL